MTTLLVGTFVVSGAHTLLWLPRAFQMRRELREAEEAEQRAVEEDMRGMGAVEEEPPMADPDPEGEE
jgi:hypothetical protein